MILAAKMGQPMQPNVLRMIENLTAFEQQFVLKDQIVDLETEILTIFAFDFNYIGPVPFIERYLRILDRDSDERLTQIAVQLCKFSLSDERFLNFRPSQIAACALLISINILQRENENNNNQNN